MNVSWDQVHAWRLLRQFVDPRGACSARQVVKRLCGVQAQVPASADLAIAVRRTDPTPGAMQDALNARELMRTWAMRGTLHLLAPEDAGAYLALLADLRSWEKPSWQRHFVTVSEMAKLAQAVDFALDGRILNRDELVGELIAHADSRHLEEQLRSGWGELLKPLAWMGLICNGPSDGHRVTFTSPRTWIPGWSGLPAPDDAAPVAIRAYVSAYGPATPAAFDGWLARGATSKKKLRAWFAELGDDLLDIEVEGERAWLLAEHADDLANTPPARGVHLLPAFDQYVLGPGTADEHLISPARRPKISKAAGWISPVVIARGRVAGIWAIADDTVDAELFGEQGELPSRSLAAEVERIGSLLGRELRLEVSRS